MADVSTPIDAYQAAAPLWRLVDDATAGEMAVKAAGEMYLPKPNPKDISQENRLRYEQYIKRAVYYNASGRTLAGLIGLAFAKFPEIKAPAALEDITKNLDGAGTTLVQHMHETLGEVLKNGRAGLLADFPKTTGVTSKAAEQTAGIRPTVSYYPAEGVINWRTIVVGGQSQLSLVVLCETHREYEGFGEKCTKQFRVLLLEGGIYKVEIWREKKNATSTLDKYERVEDFIPLDGAGHTLSEIPFTFVGSQNNGVAINDSPMRDIATVNIAHYRNSADYEDSVYFCGQPQFWISGLDVEWRDHLEKVGVYVGSRNVLPLPVGASAGILQAEPNTLAKEAMDAKERQLAALGARLIMVGTVNKTATQQDSEDSIANSVLSLCCDNVSAAYTRSLIWAAQFGNITGEILVDMPTDFAQRTIDSAELAQLIQGVQSGLIPLDDFWARMRATGVIDSTKTNDDIREEIDQNPPPALAADPKQAAGG